MGNQPAQADGRRRLRFETIEQALEEVDRLVSAERDGRLRRLGNWTLGQAMGHLAAWVKFSYTGTPLKVPFFVRWFMRLRKRKFLYDPMPSGVRIPRVEGGTLATEDMPTEEGAMRLREALGRLQREAPTVPSELFGQMTHEEWIAATLRHIELHLGFFEVAG